VSIPAVGLTNDVPKDHRLVAEPMAPPVDPLTNPTLDRTESEAGNKEPEVMSRPLKIAHAIVLGVLALSLLGLAYVHLLNHPGDAHSTPAAPTTTTTVYVSTTTRVVPATLSPSAEAAATALVSSWAATNRSAALAGATPTAVATLFAARYASGLAVDRGCSTSFTPIVCTFGPSGGASPTDPIYQIMVSQVEGGWFVSSVKIEN